MALVILLPMLRQSSTTLAFDTRGRGLIEITRPVADWIAASDIDNGLLTLFVRHTAASLVVQENADPDVRGDLERFLARLVPDGVTASRRLCCAIFCSVGLAHSAIASVAGMPAARVRFE